MDCFFKKKSVLESSFYSKSSSGRGLYSFTLEITARCNNNCRHCYVNYPADSTQALHKELSLDQIKHIIDQAVDLGALWCLITGGEPLLRSDFVDIYLYLKKKGLFVALFTNATLITLVHINLFKKYPLRSIEVSVYGVTRQTYERVSRVAGSFDHFVRGVDLLLSAGVNVLFKTMALRSNVNELQQIATFCRERSNNDFRLDPLLHLRCDQDTQRNEDIKSERLSAFEIVEVEKIDLHRFGALGQACDKLIRPELKQTNDQQLFHCGAGRSSFNVSYEGVFRLCCSLCQEDCIYDLKEGSLKQAWQSVVPRVRAMTSDSKEFLEKCRVCPIINFCLWCPAHAHLETGKMDQLVPYFCEVAHARSEALLRCKNQADQF